MERQPNPLLDPLLQSASTPGASVVAGLRLFRGMVMQLPESGEVQVMASSGGPTLICDVLHTGAPLTLQLGDAVLVSAPATASERGIVLGLVAPYAPPAPAKTLTLEATEALSLKCGTSSIELREDGRLLIRGKDVLSLAERTQRLKGGSVGIN